MLNKWQVSNFKSLAGDVALPLGQVTALCGANSSGKSSLIQSILMLKQSVNSDQIGRQIALNGHWVKLGTFKDVLTYGVSDPSLKISYEFDVKNYRPRSTTLDQHRLSQSALKTPQRSSLTNIFGEFEWKAVDAQLTFSSDFHADDALASIHPPLVSASVAVEMETEEQPSIKQELSVKPIFPEPSDNVDFAMFRVDGVSEALQRDATGDLPEAFITGCAMSNFLPNELIVHYDRTRFDARHAANFFVPERVSSASPLRTATPAPEVVRTINSWLEEHGLDPIPGNVSGSSMRVRDYVMRRMGEVMGVQSSDLLKFRIGSEFLPSLRMHQAVDGAYPCPET